MSCEVINIPKGADIAVTLTVKDQSGNIIDATVFTKLVVFINHADGTLISKYSKNAATGYGTIDLSNAATGKLVVQLLSSHTNAAKEGKLFYEIHGLYPDATATDDSVLDLVSTGNYLCSVIASKTGTLTLP